MKWQRILCLFGRHEYPITSDSDIVGRIETQVLTQHMKCSRCGHGDGTVVVIAEHHFDLGPRAVDPLRRFGSLEEEKLIGTPLNQLGSLLDD